MSIDRHAIIGTVLLWTMVFAGTTGGCSRNVDGREIRWKNGNVELVGTLALPEGSGPHPLAVFVPGSGCVSRPRADRMVREHAEHLTNMGVAVFVYDKRGCGESKGDWRDVGLEELADDVLKVIPDLIADPAVNADRVGLLGLSQGAWVSLIAAGRSDRIGFVVMLSGPPMTPAEQGHAIVELGMRAKGWDDESIGRAVELDRMVTEVYRTDSGWDEARAALDQAASEPWFHDARIGIQPRESWNWQWLRTLMDYDPIQALHDLQIPILAIYGERDTIVPAGRSQRIVDDLSASARGPRETMLIKDVGHLLRRDKTSAWPQIYWDALGSWLTRHGFAGHRGLRTASGK